MVAGGALRQVDPPGDLGDGGAVGRGLEHLGLTSGMVVGLVVPDEGRIVHNGTVFFDAAERVFLGVSLNFARPGLLRGCLYRRGYLAREQI